MSTLTGTGTLIRFILRRDRIRLAVWAVAVVGFLVSSVASFPEVYPTAADRQARAELIDNPAFVMLSGPGHGVDDYTVGAMTANEMLGFTALVMAIMSILLVVRHTRLEEQEGRTELLRAAVLGRFAQPVAALIVVGALNVVVGTAMWASLAGIPELSGSGSATFAVAATSVGLAFAGIAVLAGQVTEYARGASGLAMAALGAGYVLRAVGDIGNGALSWLSPIGWAQATQAYVDDRIWPALLGVVLGGLTTWAGLAVGARRDVAAGLLAARPGRTTASPRLSRPAVLALRMQRGNLIGWAIGMVLFGATYGSVIGEVETFATDNEVLQDFVMAGGGGSFVDAFIGTIASFYAVVAAGLAIQSTLRLRTEETAGRAEPVLATAISRVRWVGGYVTVALLGSSAVLVIAALAFGLVAVAAGQDAGMLAEGLAAGAVQLPALWVTVGLAFAVFGLAPRFSPAAWGFLAYVAVVAMLGGLLDFPGVVHDLSPFGHAPALPADEMTWTPLVVLTAIAIALVVAGALGFRRRDLETT